MHTFAAVISKDAKIGSLQACIDWGQGLIEDKKAKIVKIVKARPQEAHARVIFEITKDGLFKTPHGTVIDLNLVRKADKNGQA